MNTILGIIGATAKALFDPLALVGYFVAGIWGAKIRRYWVAVVAAFGWAAVIEWIVVSSANRIFGEANVFGQSLAPRVFGALIAVSVVFFVARAVRPKATIQPGAKRSLFVDCPECGSWISATVPTCPHCSFDLLGGSRQGVTSKIKKRDSQAGQISAPAAVGLKHLIRKLRGTFSQEWTWRVYVVLTIIGLVGVVVLDIGHRGHWDLWPDFFRASYWRFGRRFYNLSNWLVMLFIFGPFLIAKALDWITSGRRTGPPSL